MSDNSNTRRAEPQSTIITTRLRALTVSSSTKATLSSTPFHSDIKHSRAASELAISALRRVPSKSLTADYFNPESLTISNDSRPVASYASSSGDLGVLHRSLTVSPQNMGVPAELPAASLDDSRFLRAGKNPQQLFALSDTNPATILPTSAAHASLPTDRNTHLLQEEYSYATTTHLSSMDTNNHNVGILESGFSFEQLVDRLLSPTMSKADFKFIAVFLCLYRKFATPADLLSTIIHHWETVETNSGPKISGIGMQLRYLGILTHWLSDYPGDFAYPMTRHCMSRFVLHLEKGRIFAAAAKEMTLQLDLISDDDDTRWGYSDESKGTATTLKTLSRISTVWDSGTLALNGIPVFQDDNHRDAEDRSNEAASKSRIIRHSKSPSSSSSSSSSSNADRPQTGQSHSSFTMLSYSIDSARQESRLLVPVARCPLTKIQWHQFMETPNEDLANELTRIDWIMFSSIQPRDLIRHVSLQADQREVFRHLENVDRMINHFQHVAFWVASMVLLRDKAKHRAPALEKFMILAWVSHQMQFLDTCVIKN